MTLLRPWGLEPVRLLHPQDFPGKNIGVGCHFLLQGDLPNQGTEPVFPESTALKVDSLSTEPPGKSHKTNGVHVKYTFES